MAKLYYDDDADLGLIQDKTVAVLAASKKWGL